MDSILDETLDLQNIILSNLDEIYDENEHR